MQQFSATFICAIPGYANVIYHVRYSGSYTLLTCKYAYKAISCVLLFWRDSYM